MVLLKATSVKNRATDARRSVFDHRAVVVVENMLNLSLVAVNRKCLGAGAAMVCATSASASKQRARVAPLWILM